MAQRSRLVLSAAVIALLIVATPQAALAKPRGGLPSGGGNHGGNAGGNHQANHGPEGVRLNHNRDEGGNASVRQFQQLLQGGQGGQTIQGQLGNAQQPRRHGQQGTLQFNNGQQVEQFLHNGQHNHGGNWQSQQFDRHEALRNWTLGLTGGNQPFTTAWYEHHPQAWHHHHHHDHDAWQVATAAAVVGWLGWQVQPYYNPTIVYEPIPVETVIVEDQASDVAVNQTTATTVSDAADEWLTLGAYTLRTGSGDPGTRILQLAVDREGHVRGNYFDMITNAAHNVYGLIDEHTQQVRWTLESNRQLTFVATLDQLTRSLGVVHVQLPGGERQQWQLVRMESAGN